MRWSVFLIGAARGRPAARGAGAAAAARRRLRGDLSRVRKPLGRIGTPAQAGRAGSSRDRRGHGRHQGRQADGPRGGLPKRFEVPASAGGVASPRRGRSPRCRATSAAVTLGGILLFVAGHAGSRERLSQRARADARDLRLRRLRLFPALQKIYRGMADALRPADARQAPRGHMRERRRRAAGRRPPRPQAAARGSGWSSGRCTTLSRRPSAARCDGLDLGGRGPDHGRRGRRHRRRQDDRGRRDPRPAAARSGRARVDGAR